MAIDIHKRVFFFIYASFVRGVPLLFKSFIVRWILYDDFHSTTVTSLRKSLLRPRSSCSCAYGGKVIVGALGELSSFPSESNQDDCYSSHDEECRGKDGHG